MQTSKQYIRQSIIEASKKLFHKKGYAYVAMREISDLSHVGLSNIYNYYKNKEALFSELVEPAVSELYKLLDRHHGRNGMDIMEMFTEEYLEKVISEYITMVSRYKEELFLLLFRSQGTSFEKFKDNYADQSTEVVKTYFADMKRKYPDINIDVSDFTIRLHTVWMFTMLEELIKKQTGPEQIKQIIREYMIVCATGWRELIKR